MRAHLKDSPVIPYYSLLLKVPGEKEFDQMKEV